MNCKSHAGTPVVEGQTKCRTCVQRRNALRQERIAAKICPVHSNQPALEGKQCCQTCVDDSARKYATAKLDVLTRYCGGIPHCQCPRCPTTFLGFLQIDHVEGNGHTHLNPNGNRLKGFELLSWLQRHDYPTGFQVLCANCNTNKGRKESCGAKGLQH